MQVRGALRVLTCILSLAFASAGISRYNDVDVSYTYHIRFGLITAGDYLLGGADPYVRINGFNFVFNVLGTADSINIHQYSCGYTKK